MGSAYFVCSGVGATESEAFNKLVDEAIIEYGNDCYNGTISTTTLRGRKRTPWGDKTTLTDAEFKKLYNYLYSADIADSINKWECWYEKAGCLGSKEYTMEYSENWQNSSKGYIIEVFTRHTRVQRTICKTKQEAQKTAKKYAFDMGFKGSVRIETANGTTIAEWYPKVTRQSKRQLKPKNEKHWVLPLNRYLFFGWAAE